MTKRQIDQPVLDEIVQRIVDTARRYGEDLGR